MALCLLTGCAKDGRIRLHKSLQNDIVNFGGYQYVPLIRVCDAYGLKYDWDRFTRKMTVRSPGHYVIAMAGSGRIIADGIERELQRPVLFNSGTVYVPVSMAGQDLLLIAAVPCRQYDVEEFTVVHCTDVRLLVIKSCYIFPIGVLAIDDHFMIAPMARQLQRSAAGKCACD